VRRATEYDGASPGAGELSARGRASIPCANSPPREAPTRELVPHEAPTRELAPPQVAARVPSPHAFWAPAPPPRIASLGVGLRCRRLIGKAVLRGVALLRRECGRILFG
jgi:hypothetical protein